MPVYQVHKIRIVILLVLSVFFISLFSVFLLHTDVVSNSFDESQNVQFSLSRPWFRFFGGGVEYRENVDNDVQDYGDYGPADIVAEGESDDYDGDNDVTNDNSVFGNGDFDLTLLQANSSDVGQDELAGKHFAERKLHGREKLQVDEVLEFTTPFDDGHLGLPFSDDEKPYTEGGIFWPKRLEQLMPKGADDKFVGNYLHKVQHDKVLRVQPPSWDRCGRPKNQYLTLASGQHVCARYRDPHNYLVQGEVLSFYLSRLLGIHNTPIVTLSRVTSDSEQWAIPSVRHHIKVAGWKNNTTVAFIQWIDGLERSKMPSQILNALVKSKHIDAASLNASNLTDEEYVELMQWTDLIVFDYITGHYDRVASMQDAAEKEQRQSILEETVHNLVKSQSDHGLWLIDNESGILDGYTLMYSPMTTTNHLTDNSTSSSDDSGGNFIKFHDQMLNSICIFRQSTVRRIQWLSHQSNPLQILVNLVKKYEPFFEGFDSVISNNELVSHFKIRLTNVFDKIKSCAVS